MEEAKESEVNSSSRWVRLTDRFKINRKLVLMKLHLLLFFGSISGAIPSVVSYTQQITSAAMVGMLFSVLPFAQLLMKPIIGAISDKFQVHKPVFLVSIAVMAVAFFSINFIPAVEPGTNFYADQWSSDELTTLSCDVTVNELTLQRCGISPQTATVTNCTLSCKIPNIVKLQTLMCDGNCSSDSSYSISDFPYLTVVNLTVAESTKIQPLTSVADCENLQLGSLTSTDGQRSSWPAADRCRVGHSFNFSCRSQCLLLDTSPGNAHYQIVWVWVASIVAFVTLGSVLTTTDAMLMDILGNEHKADFGKNRLFGSIGWGLFSVITAQLNDHASAGQERDDFSPGYYLFLTLVILDFLVALRMEVVPVQKPKKLTKDVLALFKRAEFSMFAVATVCVGMVTSIFWTYIILFVNDLRGSHLVIGVNYAVECFLSEIPFFLISGWVVSKLGHVYSMTFVLLISGFKALCYSFIYDPWLILIPALMHGANYGIFYATAATYAGAVAPPGASATLQGLIQGLFEGLGVGLGSLIGGILYERIGGHSMFRLFGIASMVMGCVHFLVSFFLKRCEAKPIQVADESKIAA